MSERRTSGLRQLTAPFVVAPPTAATIKTRIYLSQSEQETLTRTGEFLGSLYHKDVAELCSESSRDWKERKSSISALTSSRWAGAITKSAHKQYQLSMGNLEREERMLTEAIAAITKRAGLPIGYSPGVEPASKHKGTGKGNRKKKPAIKDQPYKSATIRFAKLRRKNTLIHRLEKVRAQRTAGSPKIVLGGKNLLKNLNNLTGVERKQCQVQWNNKRLYLHADGETGKKYGNETIRVTDQGELRIKIPKALVAELGTKHLNVSRPVKFHHRQMEWMVRVATGGSTAYTITREGAKWFIAASWSYNIDKIPTLERLQGERTLAIDLNKGFISCWVIDKHGNPVGDPIDIPLVVERLPASERDAVIRHAVTTAIKLAKKSGCVSITIEDLDFVDARHAGREILPGGRKGKVFRSTVSGLPTASFRDRITAMSYTAGLWIIAVDPAYSTMWAKQHWLKPLNENRTKRNNKSEIKKLPVTKDKASTVVIGRRGKGLGARRRINGLPNRQSIVRNQPQCNPASVTLTSPGQTSSFTAGSTGTVSYSKAVGAPPGVTTVNSEQNSPVGQPKVCGQTSSRSSNLPHLTNTS